jgi:hypothetical protein
LAVRQELHRRRAEQMPAGQPVEVRALALRRIDRVAKGQTARQRESYPKSCRHLSLAKCEATTFGPNKPDRAQPTIAACAIEVNLVFSRWSTAMRVSPHL